MTRSLLIDVPLFGMLWAYAIFVVPALVGCALKQHWTLFFVGFLTFGATWFVGALRRAEPDSPWARAFNAEDPEPDTRAFDRPQARRRWRVALVAVGVVLILGCVGARPVPIVGVDGESLQASVGGGIAFTDTCDGLPDGVWRCYVYDDSISGDVPYRVRVGPLGCWKASPIGERTARADRRMDGCLTFFHTGFAFGSKSADS